MLYDRASPGAALTGPGERLPGLALLPSAPGWASAPQRGSRDTGRGQQAKALVAFLLGLVHVPGHRAPTQILSPSEHGTFYLNSPTPQKPAR